MGAGIDARITNNLYGGVEISARDLDVPAFDRMLVFRSNYGAKRGTLTYICLLAAPSHIGLSGVNSSMRDSQDPTREWSPYRIHTLSAPLSVNYFDPSGIFARVLATYVQQEVNRPGDQHLEDKDKPGY